jgi:hypothetical protein
MTNSVVERKLQNKTYKTSAEQHYKATPDRSNSSTLMPQANQQPQHQAVPTPIQTEQSPSEDRFSLAIKDLERRYAIYDTRNQWYSQEAVDATLNKMDEFVAAGYDPVLALLTAGESVAPFYMQKAYEAAVQTQLQKHAGQVNTPRPKSGQEKLSIGSGSVPAYEPNKCQFKPVMTDEDLRNCGIFNGN